MNIAAVDIAFALVIVVFALRGAARGFVSEAMSLAAVVFGLLSAIFFFRAGADFIRERLMPDVAAAPEIIAFAALFLAVFAVAKIVESMLRGIIDGFGLGGPDRALGAFLGFAEGIVAVCALLILISVQPLFDSGAVLRNSFFAELLMPFLAGRRWELPGMAAQARAPFGGMGTHV